MSRRASHSLNCFGKRTSPFGFSFWLAFRSVVRGAGPGGIGHRLQYDKSKKACLRLKLKLVGCVVGMGDLGVGDQRVY